MLPDRPCYPLTCPLLDNGKLIVDQTELSDVVERVHAIHKALFLSGNGTPPMNVRLDRLEQQAAARAKVPDAARAALVATLVTVPMTILLQRLVMVILP